MNTTSLRFKRALSILAVAVGCSLASSTTVFGAEFGLISIDFRAGIAVPSDWDNGTTFGISADVGQLIPGLYLHPGIRYSVAKQSVSPFFGVKFELEVTDIAVGAEVRYFPANEPVGWYFGGGAYVHFIDYERRVLGFKASTSTESFGPAGVAGYRWRKESLSLFVEARYDLADVFDRAELLVGIGFGGR